MLFRNNNYTEGNNEKIISALTMLTISAFVSSSAFSGHHKATFQYGGDWVDTTVVANGDYFIIVGAFVGTNEMVTEAGEVIITNFTCP